MSQKARLVKALDGGDTILAEVDCPWQLQANGNRLTGSINGEVVCDVEDGERPLTGGGVALVCEEGRTATNEVAVVPVSA